MTLKVGEGSTTHTTTQLKSEFSGTGGNAASGGSTSTGQVARGALAGGQGQGDVGNLPPAKKTTAGTQDEDLELWPPDQPQSFRSMLISIKLAIEKVNEAFAELSNQTVGLKREERETQVQQMVAKMDNLLKKMRAAADSLLRHLPGWAIKIATVVIAVAAAYMLAMAMAASGGLAAAPVATSAMALISCIMALSTSIYAIGSIASEAQNSDKPFGITAVLPGDAGKILDDLFQFNLPGMITDSAKAAGVVNGDALIAISVLATVAMAVTMIYGFYKASPALEKLVASTVTNCQRINTVMQVGNAAATGAQAGVTHEVMSAEIDQVRAQAASDEAKLLMDLASESVTRLMQYITDVISKDNVNFDQFLSAFKNEEQTSSHMLA